MASDLTVRVNQGDLEAFVIKLNIGQLNGYSVQVRMKYWSNFATDKNKSWSQTRTGAGKNP